MVKKFDDGGEDYFISMSLLHRCILMEHRMSKNFATRGFRSTIYGFWRKIEIWSKMFRADTRWFLMRSKLLTRIRAYKGWEIRPRKGCFFYNIWAPVILGNIVIFHFCPNWPGLGGGDARTGLNSGYKRKIPIC